MAEEAQAVTSKKEIEKFIIWRRPIRMDAGLVAIPFDLRDSNRGDHSATK